MFLSALVLPKQLGVTHKIHTTPCCIAFAPSMMGSNVAECRGPAAISLPLCRLRTQSKGTCGFLSDNLNEQLQCVESRYCASRKKMQRRANEEPLPYLRRKKA